MVPLALGLLLTAVALAAAGRRIAAVEQDIRRRATPVDVVVAAVAIAPGETYGERNLAKKSLPAAGTGQRNIPASEYELLLGARARTPVPAGEPVLWTDVEEPCETETFSRGIVPGRRALTLGVDVTSSFAGMIQPGDRVDLLCGKEGKNLPTWVRDIPVVAVDRNHDRVAKPSGGADAATVTLMVTPEEGARIASIAASGKLHWFLRNPGDNAACSRPGAPFSRLSPPVEVWKAGIRIIALPPGKERAD